MKITADTTIEKVLAMPGAREVLAKHRVPCLSCPMAQYEVSSLKLGDVCRVYGIDTKELLKELNKVSM